MMVVATLHPNSPVGIMKQLTTLIINIHGNQIEPSDSRGFTQAVVLGCGQCVEGGDDGGDGDDVRHVLLCCDADCRD